MVKKRQRKKNAKKLLKAYLEIVVPYIDSVNKITQFVASTANPPVPPAIKNGETKTLPDGEMIIPNDMAKQMARYNKNIQTTLTVDAFDVVGLKEVNNEK